MTVDDHAALYAAGLRAHAAANWMAFGAWMPSPTPTMPAASRICNFSNLPDGRFVARYELMGLMEGLVTPSFLKDHFQLNDFTPFHDEIRKRDRRFPGRASM